MKRWFFALLLLLSLNQLSADNIVKTVVDGEVINASDWNAEFLNIYADVTHSIAGTWTFTKAGTPITITPASAPAANTLIVDINNTGGSNLWSLDYEGDTVRGGSDSWTVNDSATATTTTFTTKIHTSTGTAAASFGIRQLFQLEDASGNTDSAGAQDIIWTDATHGSEDADVVFSQMVAGALTETFRVKSTGSITIAGGTFNATSAPLTLQLAGVTEADLDTDGFNVITGDSYQINNTSVLNATTLGSSVVTSSLTTVGTLTTLATSLNNPDFTATDAATNSAGLVLTSLLTSTGTPLNGFGASVEFSLEDGSGASNNIAGTFDVVWADATDGSEDADVVFKLRAAGVAAAEKFRFSSLGNVVATGTGGHAFGAAASVNNQFLISGAFTGSAGTAGLGITSTLTVPANGIGYLFGVGGTLVEAGSGTHSLLMGAYILPPTITGGAGAVTNAYTLYVNGDPAASGAVNRALEVVGTSVFTGTASVSSLTSGRVLLAGASGLLTDDAGLTFGSSRLTSTGNLTFTGTAVNAIGAATIADAQIRQGGAFVGTSGNTNGFLAATFMDTALAPAANRPAYGLYLGTSFTEAGSGTHAIISGLYSDQTVTAGAGTTTLAAGVALVGLAAGGATTGTQLYIAGDASGGATNNYSMYIAAGTGVRWGGYGSGAATFDANGNITSVSDERLKDIDGPFNRGLNAVLGIKPILYHYNEESKLDTVNQYAGFSAQQVMKFIPEAVGKNPDGFYSIQDRTLTAVLFKAIQELSVEVDELRAAAGLSKKARTVKENVGEAGIVVSPPAPPKAEAESRRVR